jgi:hypothetical protein
MTTHIAIATPCYGNTVFTNYLTSMIRLMIAWKADAFKDTHFSFLIRGGDSLIPRVRNSIVAEFLSKEEYTHLLWIDADIGFSPEDILRLLNSGHDVACGVYPLKKINFPDNIPPMTQDEFKILYTSYPFNPISRTFNIPPDGFVEVLDAPTGLMLVKRDVLKKMMGSYPEMKYKPDTMLGLEGIAAQIDDYYYRFFDVMVDEAGRYLSEDYAFCLAGKSLLQTEDYGLKTIRWVVENKYSGKVLSINNETGAQEWNTVTAHWNRRNGKRCKPETKKTWVRVNTDVDNNKKPKLICTSDHSIGVFKDLMNPVIEYVKAEDAAGLYTIRHVDPKTNENRLFNKDVMSAAIGTLMGDASIARFCQMSITHCDKQLDYLLYKQKIFGGKIDSRIQTGYSVGKIAHRLIVPVNAQTRHLRNLIGGTKKKGVEHLLPYINDIALAFWYMDDGSIGSYNPMLSTYGFTYDEHILMQDMFKNKWDIKTSIHTKTAHYKGEVRKYNYLYINAESRDTFFELIAQHVIESMAYKLPEKYRGQHVPLEIDDGNNFAASFIKSVTPIPNFSSNLYDIEVENNHNFIANGGLVHNCRRWQKMGGKVYADMHSRLTHQGQYLYEGNVLKTLVARTEMLQKQADAEAAEAASKASTEPVADVSSGNN